MVCTVSANQINEREPALNARKTAMIFRGPRPFGGLFNTALVLYGAVKVGLIAAVGFDSLQWPVGH